MIEQLCVCTLDFIAPDMWPHNSPDLKPVNYAISGQSYSSMCIRPESMTSSSCDSVLSPCGVDWNSTLWMTPLISANVVWEPVSTPKVDILNITQAYKRLVRNFFVGILIFFMQIFQCSCEKSVVFWFCTGHQLKLMTWLRTDRHRYCWLPVALCTVTGARQKCWW